MRFGRRVRGREPAECERTQRRERAPGQDGVRVEWGAGEAKRELELLKVMQRAKSAIEECEHSGQVCVREVGGRRGVAVGVPADGEHADDFGEVGAGQEGAGAGGGVDGCQG